MDRGSVDRKKSFDQLPNLTESFDQVKRSSEIRSSEQFPIYGITLGQRETEDLPIEINPSSIDNIICYPIKRLSL